MGILSKYFSQTDLSEIKQAVKDAESKTSGEIVPFFAEASHHYKEFSWYGSFIGGGISGFILIGMESLGFHSWSDSKTLTVTYVWLGAMIGLLIPYFSPMIRRFIIPLSTKSFFVNLRAKEAFLDEEIFLTQDRTGILIYISLYERIVRVLPDLGISKIVPQSDWDTAVNLIVQGMKSGKKKEGIIASILFCGTLLEKYGIHIKKDDKNEISDEIRDGGTQL
ncbi:MAG: hypothetical protein SH817_07280 [Leptospira sp.]|nr:hypothetical protein [Leptospira sp.]